VAKCRFDFLYAYSAAVDYQGIQALTSSRRQGVVSVNIGTEPE